MVVNNENLIGVPELSKQVGIPSSKIQRYIKENIVKPTVYSLTGRHKFNDIDAEQAKNDIQEQLFEENEYITAQEVSRILKVSPSVVKNYTDKGKLKVRKTTKTKNLYSRSEIYTLANSLGKVDIPKEDLLTTYEIGQIFGMSTGTVERMIKRTEIVPDWTALNGRVYLDKKKINHLMHMLDNDKEYFEGLNKVNILVAYLKGESINAIMKKYDLSKADLYRQIGISRAELIDLYNEYPYKFEDVDKDKILTWGN